MSKTRIISDIPTADANGNILHIQELAGPSSEDKPTVGLANGSLHMESDTGNLSVFDEDNGWNPAPGGGSSLPPVTSSDNGKVLAVEDGAWAAAANTVPITFTYSDDYKQYTSNDIISTLPDALAVSFSGGPYDLMNVVFRRFGKFLSTYPVYQGTMLVADTTSVYTFTAYVSLVLEGETYSANFIDDDTIKTNKFIVTLTPTALDYSGTMDKTVAEINAAYEAGQDVWFSINGGQAYVPLNIASFDSGFDYPSFECYLVNTGIGTGVIMYAYTQFTSDGTKQTYATRIYSLTPAS